MANNIKKIVTNPFLLFTVTACTVLWPLTFLLFTVKNDALTYYYPVRALISDALHNGELPLWTPFINFGYPLHADMQSGAWSPVVWLFGYITNFSLAGFHAELLFYFAMAGVGFYYLCRQYGFSHAAAFIFGLAYQCSGFMIDGVQFFACISSACWLPFIFLFYKKMIARKRITDGLLTGFFLYLLFTGGYPSLFIVTAYLLASHFIYTFSYQQQKNKFIKTSLLPLVAMTIVFVLLSLPAIVSFAQHLSYIDRGKTQPLSFVLENSMPPAALLSVISPFATTAKSTWLNTDPLMRNMYMGIIPLLFILYGTVSRQVKIKGDTRFFLVAGIVMLGISLGSFFFLRQAAYYVLPLMNTFRHPAILRLFAIFFLLLFGAYTFNEWQIRKDEESKKALNKVLWWLTSFVVAISIVLVIKNGFQVKEMFQSLNFQSIKAFSLTQRWYLQLPFIILLLVVLFFVLKKGKALLMLPFVVLLDIFIIAQFNIPVTVIGASGFAEVEKAIERNREGFPVPDLNASISENSKDSYSFTTGSKLHYTKKIGRNDYYITPGNLSVQEKFYESASKEKIFQKPVLFFEDDNSGTVSIKQFGANYIELTVTCSRPTTLVYLQNNYPGWQASIDNSAISIETAYSTFISIKIPAGKHSIQFRYNPEGIHIAWYISLASLVVIILSLLFLQYKQQRNAKRKT